MNTLLSIKNLCTYFDTPEGVMKAVEDVSFEVGKGETFGIVGESGSGKSVTLRSVLRLIKEPGKIVSGSIQFDGIDLLTIPEKKMCNIRGKRISLIPQEPSAALNPVLTIGEQISEALVTHFSMTKKQAWKKVDKYLEMVGISSPERRKNSYPHQLSGGMQQRCIIATAFACQADMIFADEPTTALDVTIQAQILDLLNKLVKENNKSMIFISHNIGAVAQVSDNIAVMYMGKVMESGKTDQVIDTPLHPYTEELLKCVPQMSNKKRERLHMLMDKDLLSVKPVDIGCSYVEFCPYVMDICSKETPMIIQVGDRECRCHRYSNKKV